MLQVQKVSSGIISGLRDPLSICRYRPTHKVMTAFLLDFRLYFCLGAIPK
jgi:hypothetical protein